MTFCENITQRRHNRLLPFAWPNKKRHQSKISHPWNCCAKQPLDKRRRQYPTRILSNRRLGCMFSFAWPHKSCHPAASCQPWTLYVFPMDREEEDNILREQFNRRCGCMFSFARPLKKFRHAASFSALILPCLPDGQRKKMIFCERIIRKKAWPSAREYRAAQRSNHVTSLASWYRFTPQAVDKGRR